MTQPTGGPAGGEEGGFQPVTATRRSDQIVDQIKQAVLVGQYRPGDRLPSERDLSTQFGTSRVTIRDAIRILETRGLIDVRVGSRGGAFIAVPDASHVVDGLLNLVMVSELRPEQVTEVRLVLEQAVVRMACERADESDLSRLRAICDEDPQAAGFDAPGHSARFHAALATAAHNAALELIFTSLYQATVASIAEARKTTKAQAAAFQKAQLAEHRQILEAVEQRRAEDAEELMRTHILRTGGELQRVRRARQGQ